MTRHVEHAMGTVFSLDVRAPLAAARTPDQAPARAHTRSDAGRAEQAHGHAERAVAEETVAEESVRRAVAEAVAWLHWVDETFSTYKPGSPVSRLGRGEIGLADCPPEVTEILGLCAEAAEASRGYFTACPGGRLDPSAMVKGWAIERVSRMLTRAGAVNHCVNGGGDVQLAGAAAPGRPWRVGVADPLRPGRLATVVGPPSVRPVTAGGRPGLAVAGPAARFAVATSGTAERGPHIIDPHTGRPAAELASITLTGENLTMIDAYATAAFAMGRAARKWVEGLDGVEAFAVTASGDTWRTSGFPGAALPAMNGA
ncbi:FAD:protein FMN transferase [Sphaerisporangium dianthi]|uniref:FAD:protein FMN transferase n=1 Tax=Sphaerisporangium dianthi TaxID=1436120 RepID=A0ABV9CMP3_9ACTN